MHGAALWYLTRGTGVVALLGLTAATAIGIAHAERRRPPGAPRLLIESAHRTISLLVLALLAVHIVTAVVDSFAPVRLLDAVVPFAGAYRPLWLGFGALAFDLLLAVAVTSVLRLRLGFRAWRAVHWLAYACWPVAVLHGLGTGSDVRATWMLALTLGCVAAVAGLGAWRLVRAPVAPGPRAGALAGIGAALLALLLWLPGGPLAHGWARRAGTPSRLLAAAPAPRAAGAAPAPVAAPRFSSPLAGRVRRGTGRDGTAVIDVALRATAAPARLRVRLAGVPLEGGGLSLRASAVDLLDGARYSGRVVRLDGGDLVALVAAPDGRAARLRMRLALDGGTARGTVTARPRTAVRG